MTQNDNDFYTNHKASETFGVSANPVLSPAQMAADQECKHPLQSKPLEYEPFEPHGMN